MSTPAPRRARSWLLFGSLALNLFFLGFFAVQTFHHGHGPSHWEERRSQGMWGMMRYMRGSEGGERFLDRLSSADRQVMEQLKTDFGPEFEKAWTEHLNGRSAVREILQAETRDRDALSETFTEIQANRAKFSDLLHSVIMEAYERMSDEGLAILGEGGRGRHGG
ncbi:MAG: periplasmic heavy metal sensor [Alphaproteobacteria bacterium]